MSRIVTQEQARAIALEFAKAYPGQLMFVVRHQNPSLGHYVMKEEWIAGQILVGTLVDVVEVAS